MIAVGEQHYQCQSAKCPKNKVADFHGQSLCPVLGSINPGQISNRPYQRRKGGPVTSGYLRRIAATVVVVGTNFVGMFPIVAPDPVLHLLALSPGLQDLHE
jgi:hypothetical protein